MIINSSCFSCSLLCGWWVLQVAVVHHFLSSNFIGADGSAGCLNDGWWYPAAAAEGWTPPNHGALRQRRRWKAGTPGPSFGHPRWWPCRSAIMEMEPLWRATQTRPCCSHLFTGTRKGFRQIYIDLLWIHWCHNWESLWAKGLFTAALRVLSSTSGYFYTENGLFKVS